MLHPYRGSGRSSAHPHVTAERPAITQGPYVGALTPIAPPPTAFARSAPTDGPSPLLHPQIVLVQTPHGTFPVVVQPGASVSFTVEQTLWALAVVLHIANACVPQVVAPMARHSVRFIGAVTTSSVCLVVPANEFERARAVLINEGLECDMDGALVDVVTSGSESWLGVAWRQDTGFRSPQRIQVVDRSEMAAIAEKLAVVASDSVCLGGVGAPCVNVTGNPDRRCPLHPAPASLAQAITRPTTPLLK